MCPRGRKPESTAGTDASQPDRHVRRARRVDEPRLRLDRSPGQKDPTLGVGAWKNEVNVHSEPASFVGNEPPESPPSRVTTAPITVIARADSTPAAANRWTSPDQWHCLRARSGGGRRHPSPDRDAGVTVAESSSG